MAKENKWTKLDKTIPINGTNYAIYKDGNGGTWAVDEANHQYIKVNTLLLNSWEQEGKGVESRMNKGIPERAQSDYRYYTLWSPVEDRLASILESSGYHAPTKKPDVVNLSTAESNSQTVPYKGSIFTKSVEESETTQPTTLKTSSTTQPTAASTPTPTVSIADLTPPTVLTTETSKTETTPEVPRYKFGLNTLDITYYKHNLGTNVLSFLNSKSNWSEQLIRAFLKAYNDYMSKLDAMLLNGEALRTDDFGNILGLNNPENINYWIDRNGEMLTDPSIIKGRRNRENATIFNPYTELANFANSVGQSIIKQNTKKAAETPTSKKDNLFNINNHGFGAFLDTELNPAGFQTIDYSSILELDALDPITNKRGTANRAEWMAQRLEAYKAQLDKNYDFSGTNYKTRDNYIARIDTAIRLLRDGTFNGADRLALQAIGLSGENIAKLFLETGKQNTDAKTSEELTAELNTKKIAWKEQSKTTYDSLTIAYKAGSQGLNIATTPIDTLKSKEATDNELALLYNIPINVNNPEESETQLKRTWNKFADVVYDAIKKGLPQIRFDKKTLTLGNAVKLLFESGISRGLVNTVEGVSNVFYIDNPTDLNTHSVLCWDKVRNAIYFDWAFNVKGSAAYNTHFKDKTFTEEDPNSPGYKEGGALKFQVGGVFDKADFSYLTLGVTEQAAKRTSTFGLSNVSPEAQRQKNRIVNGTEEDATLLNPEVGWQSEDIARLTSIGANVVSTILPTIPGAIAGVGGTVAGLTADILDDSVTGWQTAKNAIGGLALDLLGIVIPGTAAAKVTKGLKPFIPKLIAWTTQAMAAQQVGSTIHNGDQIIASLKKISSDEKMTVGDWQNIAQLITAITGGTNAIKSKVATNRAANAIELDKIGVGLTNTATGEKLDILVGGLKAKELKEAVAKGDATKANEIVRTLDPSYANYEINTRVRTQTKIKDKEGVKLGKDKDGNPTTETGKTRWLPKVIKTDFDVFDVYNSENLKMRRMGMRTPEDIATNASRERLKDAELQLWGPEEKVQLGRKWLETNFPKETKAAAHAANIRPKRIESYLKLINSNKTKINEALTAFDTHTLKLNTAKNYATISQEISTLKTAKTNAERAIVREQQLLKRLGQLKPKTTKLKAANEKDIQDAESRLQKAQQDLQTANTNITNLEKLLPTLPDSTILETTNLDLVTAENEQLKLTVENLRLKQTLLQERLGTIKKNYGEEGYTPSKTIRKFEEAIARRSGETVTDEAGYNLNMTPQTAFEKVMKLRQAVWAKEGGVIMMQSGGATNITRKTTDPYWFNDVYSQFAEALLAQAKAGGQSAIDDINNMQSNHYNLWNAYTDNGVIRPKIIVGDDTKAYQGLINQNYSYVNTAGITLARANNRYLDPAKGISSDNASTQWTPDGYFGSQTDDRRVLGRLGDYTNDQLTAAQAKWKELGYEMYTDPNKGNYYFLKPFGAPNPTTLIASDAGAVEPGELIDEGEYAHVGRSQNDKKTSESTKINLSSIFNPNLLGALDLAAHLYGNRKITNLYNESEVPLLILPKNYKRIEINPEWLRTLGRLKHAAMNDMAVRSLGADQLVNNAIALEAEKSGNDFEAQANNLANLVWQDSIEKAQLAADKTMESHIDTHNFNIQRLLETFSNKKKNQALLASLNLLDMSTWIQEQKDLLQDKFDEKEDLQEKYYQNAIAQEVSTNPESYNIQVSQVYKDITSGTREWSSLSPEEKAQYRIDSLKVQRKIMDLVYSKLGVTPMKSELYNISSLFSPQISSPEGFNGIIVDKNGGKVEKEKIKAKIKNADRRAKILVAQLKDKAKREDRVAKGIYTYPSK